MIWRQDLKAIWSFHEDGFSFQFRFQFFKYFSRFFWLMLFWTARVSLESLLCVECVVSLMKLKLRGGNWILPAVRALPAWKKNKHAYWEQWTFLQTLGDRFFCAPLSFLVFLQTKKIFCWSVGAQGCLSLVIMFGCLAWGIRAANGLTSTYGI